MYLSLSCADVLFHIPSTEILQLKLVWNWWCHSIVSSALWHLLSTETFSNTLIFPIDYLGKTLSLGNSSSLFLLAIYMGLSLLTRYSNNSALSSKRLARSSLLPYEFPEIQVRYQIAVFPRNKEHLTHYLNDATEAWGKELKTHYLALLGLRI